MNARILFLSTFCSASLLTSTTAMSQNSTRIIFSQGQSFQSQETTVSVDSANIKKPYTLSISAPQATRLTGKVTRNGKVIKQLKTKQASMNLSPLLSKGKQTIKISGDYKPASSSVRIKLSGPGTQVNQQTSGSGKLNQTLIIYVQ